MHVFASSGRICNATLHLPMQTDVAERFKFHSPDRVEELLPDGRNSIKSVTCEPCGEDPKMGPRNRKTQKLHLVHFKLFQLRARCFAPWLETTTLPDWDQRQKYVYNVYIHIYIYE